MIILALSTTLRGEAPLPGPEPPPAVLVHNSRREPLATPLILAAIEEVDPDLVGMVASTVWDLDDAALRERLLGEADLVLATGDDDFIKCISPQLAPVTRRRRFQAHRNGASFSVIGREMLELQSGDDALEWRLPGGAEVIDVVALLAGLDASFWDQNAGLSARVHFVEQGGPADDLPAEYARRLTARLRQIAMVMPRGAWPVRQLHDPFDRYKTIEGSDRWGPGLRVMSNYDDPFVVVLDGRAADDSRMDPGLFASMVDECRTRVVLVRPVADIMEVVWRYLDRLPRHWLQSISIAAGRPGEGLTGQFLAFATACARRGVTTIRIIGSGAFPQPAYSWDGWLPLDLVGTRPPGYFTTIEFDSPFDDMLQTYSRHLSRLAKLPTAGPAARAPSRSAPRPR
jgi:hypothetical protein